MKKLVIIGAGGHGKVCADIANEMDKWKCIVFIDDSKRGTVVGHPIDGNLNFDNYDNSDFDFFIAIGNNKTREHLYKKLTYNGFNVISIISKSAFISKYASIGDGLAIMPNSVVNAGASIGNGCIINTSTVIEHDCEIGGFTHISSSATIAGSVKIGQRTWIGANATIVNNIKIVDDVIIGAGAVVISDIINCGTYVGIPAKRLDD